MSQQDPTERLAQLLEGRVEIEYQLDRLKADKKAIDAELSEMISPTEKLELGRFQASRTYYAKESVDDKAWKLACAQDPQLNEIDRAYKAARAKFSQPVVVDFIRVKVLS